MIAFCKLNFQPRPEDVCRKAIFGAFLGIRPDFFLCWICTLTLDLPGPCKCKESSFARQRLISKECTT